MKTWPYKVIKSIMRSKNTWSSTWNLVFHMVQLGRYVKNGHDFDSIWVNIVIVIFIFAIVDGAGRSRRDSLSNRNCWCEVRCWRYEQHLKRILLNNEAFRYAWRPELLVLFELNFVSISLFNFMPSHSILSCMMIWFNLNKCCYIHQVWMWGWVCVCGGGGERGFVLTFSFPMKKKTYSRILFKPHTNTFSV